MLGRPPLVPAMALTPLWSNTGSETGECLGFPLPTSLAATTDNGPTATTSSPERVTPLHVPAAVSLAEPLLPLRGRAVRPRLRCHPPLEPLLDPVVAHGRRRVQAVGDVRVRETRDERPPRRLVLRRGRVACPHPGVAVRLELHLHRVAVRARAPVLRPAQRAHQVLHVMPVLVGHHVRL